MVADGSAGSSGQRGSGAPVSGIDVETMLKPVSEESPAGEDLRYDSRYMEVMRLSEGTPETQVGDQVKAAEEPDWRAVRDGCLELTVRTKDLRVAMLLALAETVVSGWAGLRDGLTVVQGFLEKYWEPMHPRLDPDDGNDPTERVNLISTLIAPPATFPMKFIDRTRMAPLAEVRHLGRVGMREIMIAMGDLPKLADEGAFNPDMPMVEAVFEEVELDALNAIADTVDACHELVKSIEKTLTDKVGTGKSLDLTPFRKEVAEASKQVRKRIAKRTGQAAPGEEAPGEAGGGGGGGGGRRLEGDVSSGTDAVAAMEKVIRYYERWEPSSPVPLIIKCAVQMVGKPFMDIVRVLTPDAISTLERISTPPEPPAS